MHIHYIEHVAFEGLGSIEGWVRQENHILTATRPYLNEAFPPMEAIDLLIVLGGPMNIYDENKYPWLGKEKRFLDQAIAKGRSVLGICLGAQLLANVLGAPVFANEHKEIGWFPVQTTAMAETSRIFAALLGQCWQKANVSLRSMQLCWRCLSGYTEPRLDRGRNPFLQSE
jgi:GMP synthase-like glutamine amidotransferase